MDGEPKDTRLHVLVTQKQLQSIEGWRRRQPKLISRGAAVRELLQLGLEAAGRRTERAKAPVS